MAEAKPFDTLLLPAGVYFDRLDVSGKADLTIEGESGTILDAADPALQVPGCNTWRAEGDGTYSTPFSNYVDSPRAAFVGASLGDGTRLWSYGSQKRLSSHTPEQGAWLSETRQLFVHLKEGKDPSRTALHVARFEWLVRLSNSRRVTVRNVELRHVGRRGVWVTDGSSDNSIEGVGVEGGLLGILVSGRQCERNRIRGCRVHSRFEDDWWWSDVKLNEPNEMESSGIRFRSTGPDNVAESNEVSGHFNGIASAGDNSTDNLRLVMRNNLVHDIYDDALEPEGPAMGNQVYGNVVYDAYRALSVAPALGPIHIYRNILVGDKVIAYDRSANRRSSGGGVKYLFNAVGEKIFLYHNTIIAPEGLSMRAGYFPKEHRFLNNIVLVSGSGYAMSGTGLAAQGAELDGNLYFKARGGPLFRYFNSSDATGFSTLAGALSSAQGGASGFERHGAQADPKLRLLTATDVLPLDGSPALDAAVPLPEGWPDTVAAQGSAKDIGAVERPLPKPFLRGDANADGLVNLTDASVLAASLFLGGPASACEDAADVNDDGVVDVSDVEYLLSWLFKGGEAPPSPGPVACGDDPTGDVLVCGRSSPRCAR